MANMLTKMDIEFENWFISIYPNGSYELKEACFLAWEACRKICFEHLARKIGGHIPQ